MTADSSGPTYVIDSCCVISLLIKDHANRIPYLQRLFEDADQEKCTLILPTVARLEVLGIAPQRLSSGQMRRRRQEYETVLEWIDSRRLETAELDDWTIRRAQELISGPGLSGIDAAIVATGAIEKASKVLTYDDRMLKANGHIAGLSVEPPSGALWDPDLFNLPES